MTDKILGLILAGGQSRRMGGQPKALLPLHGKTMVQRVIERLTPQVDGLLLNINGPQDDFAQLGLPVAADSLGGFRGPLAGILTGMEWAARHGYDQMISVPVDCPLFPQDLVARLQAGLGECRVAVAQSGPHMHPVFALWPPSLADALRIALTEHNISALKHFLADHPVARVEWSTDPLDPFLNVNTPAELQQIQDLIRAEND